MVLLAYQFKYEEVSLQTVNCKITVIAFTFSKPKNAPYIDSGEDKIL